uniref:CD99 antigen-like protein 2 n=1 Tax=Esox lucius TaxID=8010 RepID=A0A3P8Y3R0_ESOLU
MRNISAWSLFLVVSLLAVKVWSQGDFSLDDALDDVTKAPTVTPKPVPSGGGGQPDLDQDARHVITTTKAPPKAPKASLNPKLKPASDELDLADALDPNNDIGGKDKNKGQGIGGGGRGGGTPNNRGGNGGGSFSDDDLFGVSKDDTYKPDKGKGGRGGSQSADENNYDTDTMAETGTIAGIVSAVGVALVGAITSYISYQKKKFCFSIQQSLQGDLVKTENPDAVVATEPQVQQTLLEPPNAEPPSEENVV